MLGYATFYLVRQNFSFAIPSVCSEFGYTKQQVGMVLTVGAILYGVGKGLFGAIGDRYNARYIMVIGLFMSAIMNICLGFSSVLTLFFVFGALNHCFQSMGWPPCARMLTHWFSPVEIGTRWALWNTSQQIGSAAIAALAPFLLHRFGWRFIFYIPGIMAICLAVLLFNRLRDTPESLKLPSVEKMTGLASAAESSKKWDDEEEQLSYKETLKMALSNKLVWYVAFASFFVYICRMSIFYWGPTFLLEFKGSSFAGAGAQLVVFDIAAMFGGFCAGIVSDKVFRGRRGPVSVSYMLFLAATIGIFIVAPRGSHILITVCMILMGFFISGPQLLAGVAASDFASKKAAATASGLTGTLGYAGSALAGWGAGFVADKYGWSCVFYCAIAAAILSSIFFSLTWNAKAKILIDKEQDMNANKKD
jgi:phosphoglycerate transporter family protein